MKKILLSFTLSSVLLYANTLSDGQKQFKNKQYEKSFKTFFQVAKDGMVAKYNIASMYELGLG
ncbi:MAG: hypothetical protein U9P38_07045, partial [Campylobacterota bacterium]|nr:hypothetical protein [Campylobacterota bacterium]